MLQYLVSTLPFRLGYKPILKDPHRKEKLVRGKALAKREEREFDLFTIRPYFRIMNGHFVKEYETFPFCGFLKP